MNVKFSELQCREVICVTTGQRLGFISDIRISIPEGSICAVVVPGPCRLLGIAGRREDYIIPWNCIKTVGPDIVLADCRPADCRVPRTGKGLLF